ncbi:NUDIX domain-containing protein [Parabacteroides sp. OttesenSCG-928-N08]|nr:NUDIX domain-containing protein [Parabacteroides sp. OttesenSCG-928-N08]
MHPLHQFRYCPKCGSSDFLIRDEKAKACRHCGFVYYFNPSAAVACFIRNNNDELLVVRRAKEPAIDTLDLPGGFVDLHETVESSVRREVKEETNLTVEELRYLFSIPNIYPYSGFEVHTVDLFFECRLESFNHALADDDASEIVILPIHALRPDDFGLRSIREAIGIYMDINS